MNISYAKDKVQTYAIVAAPTGTNLVLQELTSPRLVNVHLTQDGHWQDLYYNRYVLTTGEGL